jgi:hypothetical protein
MFPAFRQYHKFLSSKGWIRYHSRPKYSALLSRSQSRPDNESLDDDNALLLDDDNAIFLDDANALLLDDNAARRCIVSSDENPTESSAYYTIRIHRGESLTMIELG